GKAEQKARRVIRQALSQNPGAVVLITGCYAQMDQQELSSLDPRAVIIPGERKSTLLELPGWLQENWQGHGDLLDAILEWRNTAMAIPALRSDPFAYNPVNFIRHSRPSIKIEDGCNNRCSYCRVCLARGPALSLPATDLLSRVKMLEAAGKAEVVLTGVNLSQYRDGELDFSGLLDFLLKNTDVIQFRISSYEPDRVDDSFLKVFSNQRVQPHVHLSIQSGSDEVLRRMARPYTAQKLRSAAAALRSVRDDPFMAADIITGFPGETEAEFAKTLALCTELDLAWIHAFPFSPRPGTSAYSMRPQIPQRLAGERVDKLMAIAEEGKRRYASRWFGKTCDLILEHGSDEDGFDLLPTDERYPCDAPVRFGTTANYLKAEIHGVPATYGDGTMIRVRIRMPGTDSRHDVIADFVAEDY
ncbi:MAG: radical SAM protein, partial [Spirochaetaceae bacterium]|nr:radical SAM protein [Spirochaetaceae bacterium]